jgi:phosphoenolpyruvate---glycerone phosphotransferase subunit DhaK
MVGEVMRKLLNDPFACVDEMLEGIVLAYPRLVARTERGRGLVYVGPTADRRVRIVTGGGSGHEPAFFGYLGPGFADAAAVGNVFASPSAEPVVEVVTALAPREGILFLYGNYGGDIMNFEMAGELLDDQGIASQTVVVTDDVSSAPADRRDERRGVAGDVVVLKAAGARADEGGSLADVVAAARHANERTRTIGVGLGPCTVPTAGRPTFDLADGEMDIGMGVHGEAGLRRARLESADAVTDELLDLLIADGAGAGGEPQLAIVNTLGATPLLEAFVVLRRVGQRLAELGLPLHRGLAGEYITSLEMTGLSITLTSLDDELTRLVDAPAAPLHAPGFGVAAR